MEACAKWKKDLCAESVHPPPELGRRDAERGSPPVFARFVLAEIPGWGPLIV
jgi:hypothetical protein